MGGIRNISSDLHRKDGRSGVRSARISKKVATDKPKRFRTRAESSQGSIASSRAIKEETLIMEKFDSVWEALGRSPKEAANLQARSSLMRQIEEIVTENGWTQAEAAKRCGVSQPRINDLLRGKISKFSIDALVNIAVALGQKIRVALEAA
jgi:predicted XRE-type DNA-binding protein